MTGSRVGISMYNPEVKNVVGSGDIASVLRDNTRPDLHFFASGVSNSKETRGEAFDRERSLLLQQEAGKHIVYFGSLSVFYADTPYTRHKREMETIVKERFDRHAIVRIGNITWGSNPNTIINYMRGQVERGEQLDIQDTFRYVVDQDEFLYWVNLIPTWSCEMNIPGERMKVNQIVKRYVCPPRQ